MGDNSRFYIPVLTFLTLAAVVMLVPFWPSIAENWQNYICETNRCTIMDWLSATSGWAGFVAAGIGAYFVFGQLREQRRQTAFLLGEGDPIFELRVPAQDGKPPRFRIINWNRNLLVVNYLVARVGETDFYPVRVAIHYQVNGAPMLVEKLLVDGKLPRGVPVDGWIDRQKPPHQIEIEPIFDLASLPPEVLKTHAKVQFTILGIDPAVDQKIHRFKVKVPQHLIIPQ